MRCAISGMIKHFLSLSCFLVCVGSQAAAQEWSQHKSEHFVVYSQKAPSRFVADAVSEAERIYADTTTTLGITRYEGWTWEDRVKIYIYDNAQEYRQSSGHDWSAGVVSTKDRMISTYPSAKGFFDSVLPHELGHIIFRDYVGQKADVPLWFEEGVAMSQEKGRQAEADDALQKAMAQGRFMSLPDLNSADLGPGADPEFVELFYAEAASVVGFILQDGEEYRFSRLCNELRQGARFETALKKSYMKYPTLNDLDKAWRERLEHE